MVPVLQLLPRPTRAISERKAMLEPDSWDIPNRTAGMRNDVEVPAVAEEMVDVGVPVAGVMEAGAQVEVEVEKGESGDGVCPPVEVVAAEAEAEIAGRPVMRPVRLSCGLWWVQVVGVEAVDPVQKCPGHLSRHQ